MSRTSAYDMYTGRIGSRTGGPRVLADGRVIRSSFNAYGQLKPGARITSLPWGWLIAPSLVLNLMMNQQARAFAKRLR